MSSKITWGALAVAILSLLALASSASAFKVISEAGKEAGQTRGPEGMAVDFETGHLFVADRRNNRVDVFDKEGNFLKAFGWGVKDGEAKLEVCTTSCLEGKAGSGAGQLNAPIAIAVDNDPASASRHSVYVVDSENSRVEKFSPEGEFQLAFGSAGAGEGQFSKILGLGVGPAGIVYVVDGPPAGGEFEIRLQKFESTGVEIAPQHLLFKPAGTVVNFGTPLPLAVDSGGNLYLGFGPGFSQGHYDNIGKYDDAGNLVEEIDNVFEENVPNGESAFRIEALAFDAEGNLYVASSSLGPEVSVIELGPSGNRLRRFGFGSIPYGAASIAPDPSATGVYLGEALEGEASHGRIVDLGFPAPGPLVLPEPCNAGPLGNTKATLSAEVDPEGKATKYHFELVDDDTYQKDVTELGAGHGFDHAKREPAQASEDPSLSADFKRHEAAAEATVVPETKYHCRVIATNSDGATSGEEGTFTSLPPLQIGANWSSGVGVETATLNAEVNPLGIPTTGYFEYVSKATYEKDIAELGPEHGFDHASKAPDTGAGEEPIEFGAGEKLNTGEATISGLAPGTAYRWRIVATDSRIAPKEVPGPVNSLRTFGAGQVGEVSLPDHRGYELVSPAQKNSAEVAVPGSAGGLTNPEIFIPINAAAGSGEAITYASFTSFGGPEGSSAANQYLSKRTANGWGTESVAPFGFIKHPLNLPYRGFTAGDLRFGAFVTSGPSLTPEAPEGFNNLYLRDNQTGAVQVLTIEAPQGPPSVCSGYAGASADGKHAIFADSGAMVGTGVPPGEGFSLYEWSAGKGLALVSVLPDGNPAPPVQGLAIAAGTGFGRVGANCGMDQAPIRHAISTDGSVIFWTYGGKYLSSEHPLFARIDGTETIQLDAKTAGEKNGGGGEFWSAAADGSAAVFSAPGKLTADAKAGGQLYRYDTTARTITDLTPGKVDPQIEGVIGASEDGNYAYFVGLGALTGEEENAGGQKAVQGAHNLYVSHEGNVRFIARLSEADARDWNLAPERLTARVTPDGRHLAFLAVEAKTLSGYDSTVSSGLGCHQRDGTVDPRCPEAYIYDADNGALTCASCNPTGARPQGPATLPGWSNPYEGPRYLSDDGSKLFFESGDVLSGADENKTRDVYEFERAGSGTCSSESAGFDPTSGGCINLISSGKSDDESYLLDASSDGRDVFLSTRSSLVGWDSNENYDVYDARENGGFPEPSNVPICQGEGCKPPAAMAPAVPPAATPHFQSSGNTIEKPKAKHKKKAKHKAKKKHDKANHKRRAGR
jgi:DNA-binding beta-propeller fold protein YncE